MTLRRFLAFVLVFLLGFVSCAGAIVGVGYWGYKNVSLNKLSDMGIIQLDPDTIRDPEADVDIASLTVQGLLSEIKKLSSASQPVTLEMLIDRYQLKLPDEAQRYLPEGLRSAPLATLMSREGVDYILKNTSIDYLFGFLPSDALSAPAREALSGKTLAEVVEMDMQNLLSGVKLGYVTGVKYEKDEDGTYVPVYADPSRPTLMELLGSIDIADALDVFANGGDMGAVISKHMQDVTVEHLLGSMTDLTKFPLQGAFTGLTLGDVLVYDETQQAYTFDIGKAVKGKTIASILGYTAVPDDTGTFIKEWIDGDGEPVYGIFRGMAQTTLDGLGEDNFDIMSLMKDVYIGDVMQYRPVFGQQGEIVSWKTSADAAVTGLNAVIADVKIGSFTDPDFVFTDVLVGVYVGDLMNYTPVKGDPADPDKVTGWIDHATGEPLSGMELAMANIDLGRLMQGGDYKIQDALGGLCLGELLGYKRNEDGAWCETVTDTDAETGGETEKLIPVSDLYVRIANLTVGEMMADGFEMSTVFDSLYLGDVMGYDRIEQDGAIVGWKGLDGETAVEGVDGAIANIDLGRLLGKGEYDVLDVFDDLLIGEAMSYKRGEQIAQDDPDTEDKDETEYQWWRMDAETQQYTIKVTGVEAKLANYRLGDLLSGKAELNAFEMTEGMTVGEILGYTKDAETGKWMDGGEEAGGIMASLADLAIGDLTDSQKVTDAVQTVKVGVALGYTQDPETGKWMSDGSEVEGVMAVLSGKTIGELGSADRGVGKMMVGELLGYSYTTRTEDGKTVYTWKNGNADVTGVMAVIASKTIDELGSGENGINKMMVGELLGYSYTTRTEDGKTVYTWTNGGAPVGGIVAAIAHLTLDQIGGDTAALTAAVKSVKVGDAMGYTLNTTTGKWMSGDSEVKGVMAALADHEIGKLDDDEEGISAMPLGKLLGYTETASGWKDASDQDVTGVLASISGLSISELSDGSSLTEAISGVCVGDAMGYTLTTTGKWMSGGREVTGFMATISGKTIGELDSLTSTVTVGELMGYTPVYDESIPEADRIPENASSWLDGGTPVKGAMAAISSAKIDNLQGKINGTRIGNLIDYTEVQANVDGVTWHDGEGYVSPLINKICNTELGALGSTISGLTVADLFTVRERQQGFLKLIDPTTPLTSLSSEITETFENVTMGELKDAGVITFSEDTENTLNLIDKYHWEEYEREELEKDPMNFQYISFEDWCKIEGNSWKTKTIGEFINSLGDLGDIVEDNLQNFGGGSQ